MMFGLLGGFLSLNYFLGGRAGKPYNFYVNLHRGIFRFMTGTTVGLGLGYWKWGDRQRMHNAYVAEKLRRRYPESINLKTTDLWKLKGAAATHEFY